MNNPAQKQASFSNSREGTVASFNDSFGTKNAFSQNLYSNPMKENYTPSRNSSSSRTERTLSLPKGVEVQTERTLSLPKGNSPAFFKSFMLSLAIFVAGIGSLWGQVALITASNGGFEAATSTAAANGWTAVGTSTRTWRVGTAGGAATGTKAAYWGTTTAYGGSAASAVGHFYRDIVIPSGATNVFLNYKLKYPTVDNTYDYFYVFTTTTTNTPANGVIPTTGYTNRFTNTATTYAGFTAMPQVDLSALAGTTVRLVFTFKTDAATPNAAPAVDDITLTYVATTACSGTPAAGTAAISSASGCPSTNFTLNSSGVTSGTGITYQWQTSTTAGGTYTNVGAAGSSLTTSTATTAYYRLRTTCSGSGLVNYTNVVSYTVVTCCTNTLQLYDTYGDGWNGGSVNLYVGGALLGNYTLASGAGPTTVNFSTFSGQAIQITYTAGSYASENYFNVLDGGGIALVSNWYPNTSGTWNGTASCPAPCTGTPSPGNTLTSSASVASGSTVNLSLSTPPVGTGLTYQWQSGPSNTGPWTTFGATSSTQTSAALASTTWFKCNVTCSGSTGASNPVQVTVTVSNNIPYSGSSSVSCGTSTAIYDHGGSAGNYLDNANGYIVLNNAAGSTAVISITGTYDTEGSWDFLRIYDGTGTGGTLLASYSGYGTITPFTSAAGQTITVQFQSDGSTVYSGIALNASYSGSCAVPACSGTPNPGATTATSSQVFAGGSTTLGITTAQIGTGISYVWQSGPSASGPWNSIGGATSATYVASPTTSTYYQCVVTCSNGGATGTSTPILISFNPYCNPIYTTGKTDGDLISNISISGTTLSNNSGTAQVNPSYTFFTGQPNYTANLVAANSYTVTVTVGTWGTQGIAAWIDYNDDNIFDASEKIGNTSGTIGSGTGGSPIPADHTATFTINLSCNPSLGTHRMRVRDVFSVAGPTIDPCATYTFGETEDYLVTIVAGTPFTPTFSATPTTPNCVGTQVTYTATAGQTSYDWGFPGTAGVDYTLVSGGTATSNTAVVTYTTSGSKIITLNYASPLGCTSSGAINNTIALGMGTLATTPNNGDVVWRGSSSTDWATPSNWYTFNSGSYSVAGAAPNNTSSLIIPVNTCVTQQPTIAGAGTVNAKDVVIETGAALTMTTGTLNVAGNFTNSGTFTPGTGTVNFMLNGIQTVTIGSSSFYNLGINLGLLQNVVPIVQLTGNTTINGDYTNSSGSLNLNSFDLTIGGNYLNSVSNTGFGDDGLIPGIGNVIFNKASGIQTLSQAQGLDFYTIQHTGAGTLQLISDLSTTGDIINSAGTFDANDKIITVRNDFTNTATFTPGTGGLGEIYFEKSGGTQTLTSGGAVFQKFAHTGNGTLNLAGIVEVKGDVVIDAPISAGTSTLKLSGTGNQTMSGTQSVIALKDMTVAKTTGTVTLSKPVRVDGALTMTQGNIITTATNKLEIGSSTSALGSVNWTSGNVVGPMRRWFAGEPNSGASTGIFPVGLSNVNRYAQINFTAAPGSGGYIDMEYKAGAPITQTPWTYLTTPDGQLIQNYENEGYWDITPYDEFGDDYPSGLNTNAFTLKLRANGLASINDISVTRIIRSPGPDHTTWEPAGFHLASSGQITDFAIESNSVTGFSWFNIGAPNNQPLPVELLNFNGTCEEGMVNLVWQTASEFNSSHFDVEKSTDGETWRVLATVPSAGTSNELLTYQTVDNNGTFGANYYRLRQVDIDGKEKLYDPINVSCVETTVGYFTSYPNPSGNEFQVIVNNKEILGACTLNIVDAQGKVIDQRSIEVKDGINMFVISETLNPGIYFLNITNGTKTTQVIKHAVK